MLSFPSPTFFFEPFCLPRVCAVFCSEPSAKPRRKDLLWAGGQSDVFHLCDKVSNIAWFWISAFGIPGGSSMKPHSQPQPFIRNKAGMIELICCTSSLTLSEF